MLKHLILTIHFLPQNPIDTRGAGQLGQVRQLGRVGPD